MAVALARQGPHAARLGLVRRVARRSATGGGQPGIQSAQSKARAIDDPPLIERCPRRLDATPRHASGKDHVSDHKVPYDREILIARKPIDACNISHPATD